MSGDRPRFRFVIFHIGPYGRVCGPGLAFPIATETKGSHSITVSHCAFAVGYDPSSLPNPPAGSEDNS
jgi:hypothetical protein